MKKYLIPQWLYHAAFQTIGVSCSFIHFFIEGTPPWTAAYGCTLQRAGSFSILLGMLVVLLMFAATCANVVILIRMCQVRQFTNFIVVHAVWVQIAFSPTVLLIEGGISPSCGLEVALKVIFCLFGLFSFIARLLDKEFRRTFRGILMRKEQEAKADNKSQLHGLLASFTGEMKPVESKVYYSVFEHIQLKFILDSLISLSFYIASNSHLVINDSSTSLLKPSDTKEAFYTIDAQSIKEVLQDDNFSKFFDNFTAYRYNVIEYFPEVFRDLRDRMGITDEMIMHALNPIENLLKLESIKGAKGGSSGAFIYISHNNRFVIKTINTSEKLIFLRNLLPSYVKRIHSDDTAFARIWAVFQVQCVGNYYTNLILMDNVSLPSKSHIRTFDLKGSLYERKCKLSGKAMRFGKDTNFLEELGSLRLVKEDAEALTRRLEQDASVLSSFNIMDYSLLVTEVRGMIAPKGDQRYLYKSSAEGTYYMIALIDYFQEYTFKKKAERFWKTRFRCVNPEDLSSMEPESYR
eukprot:CAMPEP_0204908398 /NCGR_PEP_ID=MMETSP1397-20131031/7350_1 /ASSEMBLY_ACC=CAM_ASM_000891 /TAXON_ID=49980 /ORGANISM="Climacostomum Climacostomum virens, Strain Stock W-24" /LENGTH=519 /DNA_ID=CAMNT_0052077893 /DNA_START=318 /DNA_END=1873 /DNA_ORIENTATION=-